MDVTSNEGVLWKKLTSIFLFCQGVPATRSGLVQNITRWERGLEEKTARWNKRERKKKRHGRSSIFKRKAACCKITITAREIPHSRRLTTLRNAMLLYVELWPFAHHFRLAFFAVRIHIRGFAYRLPRSPRWLRKCPRQNFRQNSRLFPRLVANYLSKYNGPCSCITEEK